LLIFLTFFHVQDVTIDEDMPLTDEKKFNPLRDGLEKQSADFKV